MSCIIIKFMEFQKLFLISRGTTGTYLNSSNDYDIANFKRLQLHYFWFCDFDIHPYPRYILFGLLQFLVQFSFVFFSFTRGQFQSLSKVIWSKPNYMTLSLDSTMK